MSKILIWETLSNIGGGQEMTLKIADILKENNKLHFLIPAKGELSQALDIRNIDYTVIGDQTMPKGQKGFKGLIRFILLTFLMVKKGAKALKDIKADILYAPGPAALVWSAMCAKHNTKVIWHLHHMFQSNSTLKLLNIFSAKKCVKAIIATSDCTGDQINNKRSQHKKITIYNPVSAVSKSLVKKNLCDEYKVLDRELKIAQIGFITPTKNQLLSLEVMKNLTDRDIDASLAIIGSVRENDEDYKQLLDKKVEEYNLNDRVVFTGYRTDVDEIIGTFDVLFVPSYIEGFSLVSAQAIMQNIPVLSIDGTGCTELVTKSGCGMIFSSLSEIQVVADTLLKTVAIDVKKTKEKHSDFILSECSYDNFKCRISGVFSL